MSTLRIEVTAEDIAKGEQGLEDKCPIARAMTRAGLAYPLVDYREIAWMQGQVHWRADVSEEVEAFIEKFDGGEPVRPFAFEVEAKYAVVYDDDEELQP